MRDELNDIPSHAGLAGDDWWAGIRWGVGGRQRGSGREWCSHLSVLPVQVIQWPFTCGLVTWVVMKMAPCLVKKHCYCYTLYVTFCYGTYYFMDIYDQLIYTATKGGITLESTNCTCAYVVTTRHECLTYVLIVSVGSKMIDRWWRKFLKMPFRK